MTAALSPAATASTQLHGESLVRAVASNPSQASTRLSAAQKQEYHDLTTPGAVEIRVTTSARTSARAAASGPVPLCASRTISYTQKSVAKTNLFAHGQTTEVCIPYIPGNVSTVKVYSVWRQTYTPGWDYIDGHSDKKDVNWEGRGMIQSHFRFSVAKIPAQNSYPCLQVRINKNLADWAQSKSCSLG